MNKEFDQGEIVEHKLSREWLMVLKYHPNERTYTCRTKSFEELSFYDFELSERPASSKR